MAAHANSSISMPAAGKLAAAAARSDDETDVARPWWGHLAWGFGAGVLGFVSAFVFATTLEFSRPVFLLFYLIFAVPFIAGYLRWSGAHPLRVIRRTWVFGLAAAIPFGFFVVRSVLTQDASPAPEGLSLAGNLLWLGVVYGLLDAVMLSVIPVFATWKALKTLGWTRTLQGKVGVAVLALLASVVVALIYHLGFSEYWDAGIKNPLIGNGAMSLGYIISTNPLTAVLSHIAMHVSAVLHGFTTAVQLPPHF